MPTKKNGTKSKYLVSKSIIDRQVSGSILFLEVCKNGVIRRARDRKKEYTDRKKLLTTKK